MGVRLPGAGDLAAYWDLLSRGRHAIDVLPADRLDRALYHQPGPPAPAKTYTELGGTVPDADLAPAALGLSDHELACADRAHLWLLHVTLAALRHAGLDPDALAGQRAGVYVGHARGSPLVADITYAASVESIVRELPAVPGWNDLDADARAAVVRDLVEQTHARYPKMHPDGGPFTQPNAVASLVARRLGTVGPYQAVDAACASSFAALDLAARAIHAGELDWALVGGCSYNQWSSLVVFSQAQALSGTGSFPFDRRADGFISSDGYAAIVVEPLARARAAGRNVLAVIRSIGSSCDGRGKSLWAPLREGQVEAIRRAYRDDLAPDTVQVVEAHATGTAVGDATEVAALAEVFGPAAGGPDAKPRPIASVKANIGHTRETAGLAGLIKTILAMQHGVVPPAVNYERPSPDVDWSAVPFRVPTAAEPWPDRPGLPRRAAVDAFGIGGLNYHVIVDGGDGCAGRPAEHASAAPAIPALPHAAEPIAVVGVGTVLAGAHRWAALAGVLDRPIAFAPPPPARWEADLYHDPAGPPYRVRTVAGGFLTDWAFDWRTFKIPPKQVQHSDPLQFMLIDAVAQALASAGWTDSPPPAHRRTAVYVGSIFGSDYTSQLNIGLRLGEFQRDLSAGLKARGCPAEQADRLAAAALEHLRTRFIIQDEAGSFSSSTLASRIAKHFDFMGPTTAVDAEEAGSLAALSAAVHALRSADADAVICAGGQRTMHHTRFESYDRIHRLARPDGGGFHLTEGAVAVVLRRLSDARRERQPVLAVLHDLRGAASTAGPWDALARLAGPVRSAAPAPRLVECLHSGVREDDEPEQAALHLPADPPVTCVSATPTLGMAQGASGLVGLAHLLAQSARGAPGQAEPMPVELANVGLRGLAWHARLEAYPAAIAASLGLVDRAAATAEESTGPRIVRFAAATPAALQQRIAAAIADPQAPWTAAAHARPFGPQDTLRLAVVADSPAALARKLALVRELPRSPEAWPALHEQGVFLHDRPQTPPPVAFAFAGQGSQYSGMFKALLADNAGLQPLLAEINAVLAELGQPSFEQIAWDPAIADRLGTDTWLTQISVFIADVLMHRVLADRGLADLPRLVLAHSYGEYPALCAAGAWSVRTGMLATWGRCQALAGLGEPPGRLVSTSASAAQIAEVCARFAGRGVVAPANFNSPEQTVLAVQRPLVDEVLAALEATGQVAKLLPVPQPYHSVMLAGAQPELARVLDGLEISPPRTPLLSSVHNSYVAEPADIRRRLVEQLVEPLRFGELIERAWADGIRLFIEVGPRTVLTRLIRSILHDRPVLALCTDHPKVPAAEQLLRVQALLQTQDLWPADVAARAGAATLVTGGAVRYVETRNLPAPRTVGLLHVDATARRRARLAAERAAEPAGAPDKPAAGATSEMEAFLVRFVCEQTGYPPEVVSLDQDLEADLGIDSIKKAQLLGELREHFKIQLPANTKGLSLNQFVTLRDIASFLSKMEAAPPSAPTDAPATPAPATNGRARPAARPAPTAPPDRAAGPLVCHFAGAPRHMGEEHGRLFRDDINHTLHAYAKLVGPNPLELDTVREALGKQAAFFDPAALDELRGMADGSGIPYERLVALNLGLEPEYSVAGCTQLAIRAAANGVAGLLHAANEDSPIALRLGNTLARLVQVRRPGPDIHTNGNGNGHAAAHRGLTDGRITPAQPRHACAVFGGPGQVGGINGLNAAGLVVSSTMLLDQPRDLAAVGFVHPVLVLRILEQAASIDEALEIIRHWPRVGAWSLLLSHTPSDELAYVEYDGPRWQVQRGGDLVYTTNHSRLLERGDAPDHSLHRLARVEQVAAQRPLAPDALQALLRDRTDLARGRTVTHRTMNTVCRVDNQISFVYRAAEGGTLAITPGPAAGEAADQFTPLSLADLWQPPARPRGLSANGNGHNGHAARGHADGHGHASADGAVMRRWILRSAPASAAAAATPAALDTLIVGAGPLADALAARLPQLGSRTRTLGWDAADLPTALADATIRRLIVLPAPVPDDLAAGWTAPNAATRSTTLDHAAWRPFEAVQRWVLALRAANAADGAELLAVTALGGDFATGPQRPLTPGGGALTGLFKALRREQPTMTLRVLDTLPGEPPALVVKCVEAALGAADRTLELGFVRGQRQAVQLVPDALPERDAPPAELADALAPGAAWIVTGGGRGVTARVARALGARFGVHLHLLGTTPAEPVPAEWLALDAAGRKTLRGQVMDQARRDGQNPLDAWRKVEKAIDLEQTLAEHRQAGAAFTYHAVDLADADALARVLGAIRAAGQPIRGVLHGAGVELSGDFARKTRDSVWPTLAAKVLGLQHLLALTRDDPVAAIVGFGSVSGRFGGVGQTDYSLASDLLAKLLAAHRRSTGVRATTIAWPAWGETGMAMRPESRFALEAGGQAFMPVAEGCAHVIRELLAGLPESEVLIVDRPAVLDADQQEIPAEVQDEVAARTPALADLPVLDRVLDAAEGELVLEAAFDPRREPFLIDHQFEGRPILPAVIGLEALAEAALLDRPAAEAFALADATIHAGLRFYSDAEIRPRIRRQDRDNAVHVELAADFFTRNGRLSEPGRLLIAAHFHAASGDEAPLALAPPPDDAEWTAIEYPASLADCDPRRVFHGPVLRTLARMWGDEARGWGDLTAPPPADLRPGRPAAGWRLPAALLDGCLVACGAYARKRLQRFSLPAGFERLVVRRRPQPGTACRVALRCLGPQDRYLRFDFDLLDERGEVLLAARGYRTVVLDTGATA